MYKLITINIEQLKKYIKKKSNINQFEDPIKLYIRKII